MRMNASAKLWLCVIAVGCLLTACQRTSFPSGKIKEPNNAPPYTVEANPNASAPQ